METEIEIQRLKEAIHIAQEALTNIHHIGKMDCRRSTFAEIAHSKIKNLLLPPANEAAAPEAACTKCGGSTYKHWGLCDAMTPAQRSMHVEILYAQLQKRVADQAHMDKVYKEGTVTYWQGKFLLVKEENNALRKANKKLLKTKECGKEIVAAIHEYRHTPEEHLNSESRLTTAVENFELSIGIDPFKTT